MRGICLRPWVAPFFLVLLRDGLGVGFTPWEAGWGKTYNLAEFLGCAVCALRTVRSTRPRARRLARADARPVRLLRRRRLLHRLPRLDGLAVVPVARRRRYLAIYPSAYAAIVLLLRAGAGRIPSTPWLDGLLSALAHAALGAALVFGVVASTDGPLATVATKSPIRSAA